MIVQYDREMGVPANHWKLMKIICFGEMGGPFYQDVIVVHSTDKESLVEFCKTHNLKIEGAWHEYFIAEPREKQ